MSWCKVRMLKDNPLYMNLPRLSTHEMHINEVRALMNKKDKDGKPSPWCEIVEGPYYKEGEPKDENEPEPLNLNPEKPVAEQVKEKELTKPPRDKMMRPSRTKEPVALSHADIEKR